MHQIFTTCSSEGWQNHLVSLGIHARHHLVQSATPRCAISPRQAQDRLKGRSKYSPKWTRNPNPQQSNYHLPGAHLQLFPNTIPYLVSIPTPKRKIDFPGHLGHHHSMYSTPVPLKPFQTRMKAKHKQEKKPPREENKIYHLAFSDQSCVHLMRHRRRWYFQRRSGGARLPTTFQRGPGMGSLVASVRGGKPGRRP